MNQTFSLPKRGGERDGKEVKIGVVTNQNETFQNR